MPRLGFGKTHRWIVHRLAGLVHDCAPIAPACPRPAVDSHDPARLGVADPLRNQPNEPILLLHDHLTASGPPPSSHPNLPHTLGVATLTGIRPAIDGPSASSGGTQCPPRSASGRR